MPISIALQCPRYALSVWVINYSDVDTPRGSAALLQIQGMLAEGCVTAALAAAAFSRTQVLLKSESAPPSFLSLATSSGGSESSRSSGGGSRQFPWQSKRQLTALAGKQPAPAGA